MLTKPRSTGPAAVRSDGRFLQPAEATPEEYAGWRESGEACTSLASLRQLFRDVLTEWNEGVGGAVEEFWRRIAEGGIAVERKQDIVLDTLRRGRVLNDFHADALERHSEDLQLCGKISNDEALRLDAMLNEFDDKRGDGE